MFQHHLNSRLRHHGSVVLVACRWLCCIQAIESRQPLRPQLFHGLRHPVGAYGLVEVSDDHQISGSVALHRLQFGPKVVPVGQVHAPIAFFTMPLEEIILRLVVTDSLMAMKLTKRRLAIYYTFWEAVAEFVGHSALGLGAVHRVRGWCGESSLNLIINDLLRDILASTELRVCHHTHRLF